MSWALSCLSLKEHYDEVVLYTDSEGSRVLIDNLQLPYSRVVVAYDNLRCQPLHWAFSKIKTYSMQDEPFLHIDGDIYLPNPLPDKIMKSALVAQNREYGTVYYKSMMDSLLNCPEVRIPAYLEKGLREKSVSSFNMGIFGGHDLEFIWRYCNEAFRFFDENRLYDPASPVSSINCNVIFEQVFFALLADMGKRDVACVLGRVMQDEGYTNKEFCDLNHYEKKSFFHLLGGHKQNDSVCDMLEKTMIRKYPDAYRRIISLFPTRNWRLEKYDRHLFSDISIQESIAQYKDFLCLVEKKWKDLTLRELFNQEQIISHYSDFQNASEEEQSSAVLKCNFYLSVYTLPHNWNPRAAELLRTRFLISGPEKYSDVAIIPSICGCGMREVAIDDIAYNLLSILDKETTFGELCTKIKPCFNGTLQERPKNIMECVKKRNLLLAL